MCKSVFRTMIGFSEYYLQFKMRTQEKMRNSLQLLCLALCRNYARNALLLIRVTPKKILTLKIFKLVEATTTSWSIVPFSNRSGQFFISQIHAINYTEAF